MGKGTELHRRTVGRRPRSTDRVTTRRYDVERSRTSAHKGYPVPEKDDI